MRVHQVCRQLLTVTLAMFAVGLALPILLAFTLPGVSVSPDVWNFLQLGGLAGSFVFWTLTRFTRPAPTTATGQPAA